MSDNSWKDYSHLSDMNQQQSPSTSTSQRRVKRKQGDPNRVVSLRKKMSDVSMRTKSPSNVATRSVVGRPSGSRSKRDMHNHHHQRSKSSSRVSGKKRTIKRPKHTRTKCTDDNCKRIGKTALTIVYGSKKSGKEGYVKAYFKGAFIAKVKQTAKGKDFDFSDYDQERDVVFEDCDRSNMPPQKLTALAGDKAIKVNGKSWAPRRMLITANSPKSLAANEEENKLIEHFADKIIHLDDNQVDMTVHKAPTPEETETPEPAEPTEPVVADDAVPDDVDVDSDDEDLNDPMSPSSPSMDTTVVADDGDDDDYYGTDDVYSEEDF